MTLKSFSDPTSDAARQHLLDRRNERNHPKRHRTLGRRRKLRAAKLNAIKLKVAMEKKARGKFLDAARAYWAGDADGHPI